MKYTLLNFVSPKGLTLIALCLGAQITPAFAVENQDQPTLRRLFSSDLPTIDYNGTSWSRKIENNGSTGDKTVEMTPLGSSQYKGPFFKEIKEVTKKSDNTYYMRSMTRPTDAFAFVLGTALVASCIYCWYALKAQVA